MRTFFIDIKRQGDGVKIDVGKGTQGDLVIMSRSWDSNPYNFWPPTHVAFAAVNNNVDYKFCLNNSGKEREVLPLRSIIFTL